MEGLGRHWGSCGLPWGTPIGAGHGRGGLTARSAPCGELVPIPCGALPAISGGSAPTALLWLQGHLPPALPWFHTEGLRAMLVCPTGNGVMVLGFAHDLLSSCCARLQLHSSFEADAVVSWGPSSWQKGVREKPFWYLHGNPRDGMPKGSSISELAGTRELPGPGALHHSALTAWQRQTL